MNAISGHGHLDLYARLYSAAALELGHSVVLITGDGEGVRQWLRTHCPNHLDRFTVLTRNELAPPETRPIPPDELPPLPVRMVRVWRTEGAGGVVNRLLAYGRRLVQRPLELTLGRLALGRRLLESMTAPKYRISFRDLVLEIRSGRTRVGAAPDLVFFLYLDMMAEDRTSRRYLERLGAPWAGILFHPRYHGTLANARPERYFETSTARGAAFLNPHFLAPYSAALPTEIFGLVPDVTDASLPEQEPALVSEIRRRARGRAIVAQLGSLSPEKGVLTFLQAIAHARRDEYFFVIVGEIFWTAFGPDEASFRRFVANPPENCFIHDGYVEDERVLNAVIRAADVLFAVYPTMRDSSNTLTKAALLERPVIVSNQYLMGERVTAHRLGAAVAPEDVEGILGAVLELRRRQPDDFGFAEYRAAHSLDSLRTAFGALVEAWIDRRDRVPSTRRVLEAAGA